MTVNFEARRYEDVHQAQALAEWCGGKVQPEGLGVPVMVVPDRAVIIPQTGWQPAGAVPGDWIIRHTDGMVRVERHGSQDGYCTDCGEPVWWYDSQLATRQGNRWCFGPDRSRVTMERWHALPGMAQHVVRAADGQPCQCLAHPGPHIHQAFAMPAMPADGPGITAAQVLSEALGALGWIEGWTGPDEGQPQRRIRLCEAGTDRVDLEVEGAPYTDEPGKFFRVVLTVMPIPAPEET